MVGWRPVGTQQVWRATVSNQCTAGLAISRFPVNAREVWRVAGTRQVRYSQSVGRMQMAHIATCNRNP
ncbi:hypothetical protein [Ethanoligenens sp.]|uniref:hypothetical protein n=1 Tax=Ethanoligenens sp. TaxID=2099655 RepID=UPI0039EC7718